MCWKRAVGTSNLSGVEIVFRFSLPRLQYAHALVQVSAFLFMSFQTKRYFLPVCDRLWSMLNTLMRSGLDA